MPKYLYHANQTAPSTAEPMLWKRREKCTSLSQEFEFRSNKIDPSLGLQCYVGTLVTLQYSELIMAYNIIIDIVDAICET